MHTRQCIHLCEPYFMPNSFLLGTWAMWCLFMHLYQCTHGDRVGKPMQSVVFCCPHACAWIPRVCGSAILLSYIISGLFPPYPSLYSIVYTNISVTGALLPFCMGAHGWVAMICQSWEQSHLGAGGQ